MGLEKKIYFFGQIPITGVVHIPLQRTKYINPQCELSKYEFIIITSKRAVEAMLSFDYDFGLIKIFCIGEKTARFAQEVGLNVVHVSKGYAKDLIAEIRPQIKEKKGLYLRPKTVANSYITNEVEEGTLDQAICYETLCIEKVDQCIEHPAILLFAAPSQVACFMQHFNFEEDDRAVAIGSTTFKASSRLVPTSISDQPTLESLYQKAQELL